MNKFLFCVCLLSSFSLQAQKVAVVFSGGGAKGLAHIGVLKALEENNIPVDYIIGTSMGGVVGGSYAAGYTPEEIESMVLDEKFQNWVNGEPENDFNYNFYTKDANAAMVSIKMALDSSFNPQFNTTLARDFSLNFALAEKLAQPSANAGYNFDSLFVPFRVVASDIFTQRTEVIKTGTLNNAIRATLSVPFFYKPIKIKDRYLFDGGIYNNFPVDIAQAEFNPDFIIGVNVSSKVFTTYPYDEDDELISNSLFYMLLDKSDPNAMDDSTSIYIEPEVHNYTAFDFDEVKILIDSGYSAAMRKMPELKERLKKYEIRDDVDSRRKAFTSKNHPLVFSRVEVFDFSPRQKRFIKQLFKAKKETRITLEEIKKAYFRLMSEPYFRSIYPNIYFDEISKAFVLELHGRPKNDLNIHVGGNMSSRNISALNLGGDFYYFNSFLINTYFNVYGGNFYKSAQIRSRMYFPALGHWYIEPDFTYNNYNFLEVEDILVDEEPPTILKRIDRNYGMNIGIPLGLKYKLQVSGGYVHNNDYYSNSPVLTLQDTLDYMLVSGFKGGISIFRNTLNKKIFPTNGQLFKLSAMNYQLSENYTPGSTSELQEEIISVHSWYKGELHLEKFHKYGNKSTGYLLKAVVSNQPSFSSHMGTMIYLPAFNPQLDSRTLLLQNFRSSSFLAVGARQIYEFNEKFQIRIEGYAFKELGSMLYRDENNNYNFAKKAIALAASGTAVYETPLGSLSLSFNYYDDPETTFGVLLNFGFLIFNNSSVE